jgi:hypothetical protein
VRRSSRELRSDQVILDQPANQGMERVLATKELLSLHVCTLARPTCDTGVEGTVGTSGILWSEEERDVWVLTCAFVTVGR